MATYLYCLLSSASSDAPGPLPPGIGGAVVRALPVGGMVAWVSDLAAAPADTASIASAHIGVLLAAVNAGLSPLPARVGQHFPDDAALRAMVEPRAAELSTALARVEGRVEMTLHLHLAEPESASDGGSAPSGEDAPTSGREYLERRKSELERAARDLHHGDRFRAFAREQLGDLVERDVCLAVRGARRYIVAHLVRREDAAAWHTRASDLRFDGVARTFVIGPLPPCSFSMDGDNAADADAHA